ncbi:BLUF domain-containing protein [Methylomarinum vadi]|uniref:BLUF domain-containing protein n=1 Tax=Methylomarinum vadi TaxID=438855 RepID=UPI0004DF3986|nr:BLUF domain-containing protein [Methylomarinum vadi]
MKKTKALFANSVSFFSLAFVFSVLFVPDCGAHERWVLTPEQIAQWNALPKPSFYTELSFGNVTMVAMFLLFIFGWIRLGFTGARELFPDLQARLASYGEHVPRILRVCLAWMLISSAFGVEPRTGVEPFTSPTLFVPDLEIRLLGSGWAWLRWLEFLLGLAILFGVYVRFCAVVLMALGLLAGMLFGLDFLAYGGALLGTSIYLLMQGPGRHYLPLPTPAPLLGIQSWLAAQPRARAQFIMRVLTGLTMLYLGIAFKIMQPNLSVAIIKLYQVPILSSAPEGFSLFMALVEVSAGLLMIAGILLRPLSLFMLGAFLFFASLLPETLTAHILFYGVMLSSFINSAGHWRKPEARDQAAEIVIVGGGFAALHAAMKIERLIGAYSNVNITLLHDNSNFVLKPLLPEVIGGTVQPGNVVNPIRRVIPRVNVIVGRLDSIDDNNRQVLARRPSGERIMLGYSELVLAQTAKPNTTSIPGMLSHAYPIDSVGDALHLRKCLLELIEQAEFTEDADERARFLSIAIIGSGELACSVSAEICQMLRAMAPSYPVLRDSNWQVHLYEDPEYVYADFEQEHMSVRDGCLEKAGVTLHKAEKINAVAEQEIIMAGGKRRAAGLLINACFSMPVVRLQGAAALVRPFAVDDDLSLEAHPHIWHAAPKLQGDEHPFISAADWEALGAAAGYNAWAKTQGFNPRPYQRRNRLIKPYSIGFNSFCDVKAFTFRGRIAWFLSRLSQLLAMPGLEKNLRIMIDWALVIPFRSDIAVLTPAPMARLQKIRFEQGDEIFHQGDEAEMAYVVESGRLEVIKDERKVAELGPGDYFGEITQTYLNRRAETVRCISGCELTVLSQNDFKVLTKGSGLLSKALQHLATQDRSAGGGREQGLKRIMYVSTMHAAFSDEEIVELGRKSSLNNQKLGLTGVLISVHEYFFQILEGQPSVVDTLLEKIRSDTRHRDLTILSAEYGLEQRLFSDWGMRTVCLNEESGVLLQAIRMMLRNIAQSHHIIGRYTQPAVLKLLTEGTNPLTVPVKCTEKLVLFGNMLGFSALSDRFSAEEIAEIINSYLETCSSCIIEHGGQVAEYVGTSLIAYFPFNQADAAISSCLDALRGLKALRDQDNPLYHSVYGGFGLAAGAVIEGNIGSSVKMDYTILGETINQASQLQALGRNAGKAIALSESVQQSAQSAWKFQRLSETALFKEGEEKQPVYTIEDRLVIEGMPR